MVEDGTMRQCNSLGQKEARDILFKPLRHPRLSNEDYDMKHLLTWANARAT